MNTLPRKLLLATAIVVGTVVGTAGLASAHVTVNPSQATQGSYAKLTFRVPNEKDNSSTTKVEIQFPPDVALASVSVQPTPGWTVDVAKAPPAASGAAATDPVSVVTWSGGTIKPGQFDEFNVSVGPLPTTLDHMTFKALQTYDNGDVVSWIEEATASDAKPQHPAPVLKLVKAGDSTTDATPVVAGPSKSDVSSAKRLGTIGIIIGALGLAAAIAALATRPRTKSGS